LAETGAEALKVPPPADGGAETGAEPLLDAGLAETGAEALNEPPAGFPTVARPLGAAPPGWSDGGAHSAPGAGGGGGA
jgi:hypothetical protein